MSLLIIFYEYHDSTSISRFIFFYCVEMDSEVLEDKHYDILSNLLKISESSLDMDSDAACITNIDTLHQSCILFSKKNSWINNIHKL